jgi:hypothetical protein
MYFRSIDILCYSISLTTISDTISTKIDLMCGTYQAIYSLRQTNCTILSQFRENIIAYGITILITIV